MADYMQAMMTDDDLTIVSGERSQKTKQKQKDDKKGVANEQ